MDENDTPALLYPLANCFFRFQKESKNNYFFVFISWGASNPQLLQDAITSICRENTHKAPFIYNFLTRPRTSGGHYKRDYTLGRFRFFHVCKPKKWQWKEE